MNGASTNDADQRARFIEAAQELGADDDEATFKAKLGAIARQKAKGMASKSREDEP